MMKKLLLFCAVFLAGTAMMFAQFPNIGLLGGSTVTGWGSDTDMVTTDGVVYTLNDVVITVPDTDPGVKFRQDDAWTINWGGSGFPGGTAAASGANIPAINGTYNVTFNLSTLAYSFVPVGVEIPEVTVGGEGVVINLTSADGVHYSAKSVTLPQTTVSFTIDDTGMGWGSSSFPTGTAVAGSNIPVPANMYNITFNRDTKVYSFDFVVISLVGEGAVDWNTDTDLASTDGVNYKLTNFTFPGGGVKFRQNHDYTPGWGSTEFPSGTGSTAGDAPNIPVTAGAYDVTFNRETGVYNFTAPTAGTQEFLLGQIAVYPNPAQNQWNFTAGTTVIDRMDIMDVTGKVIFTSQVNASAAVINAEGFAPGMYFAKLTLGNAAKTVKLIKK